MAVAGSFYPAGAGALAASVEEMLGAAWVAYPLPAGPGSAEIAGVLVPHAGLVYSGVVAAAGWRALLPAPASAGGAPASSAGAAIPSAGAAIVVLLGTNHGAGWLDGVGAWDGGPWRTPLGEVAVDRELTDSVLALGAPFEADVRCHLGEHSLEVQLPFVRRLMPDARIVPLSVGAGTGGRAIDAGERLGRLAISSDMAHYPAAGVAERVTATLLPSIAGLDPAGLARAEAATRREPGVSCGMCGIEPSVLGLAALRAMGAAPGVPLAAATSADAGGDPRRTVGYLAVAFGA
jgi:AmmeMemoRadiSam system protein B